MTDRIFTINHIGGKGDGVGLINDRHVYVPYALPGEIWAQRTDGSIHLISASPSRSTDKCPHYRRCGGCIAQHFPRQAYEDWKVALVKQAFARRGIEIEPDPLVTVPPRSRRRAALTAITSRAGVVLGFHRARSTQIEDLADCAVLAPSITAALDGLRELITCLDFRNAPLRIRLLVTNEGLDIEISGMTQTVSAPKLSRLAELAVNNGFARLTLDGQTVLQRDQPHLAMSGVSIPLSSSRFVQAVAAAENAMVDRVLAACDDAKEAADLFCGVGTFTFALARKKKVHAVDGDGDALNALKHARDRATGLKPITTQHRDLFREPLSRNELNPFAFVVFDPPRSGARAQALQLAESQVETIVAISCQPGTLARDSRILVDGGYELETVTPIDQFQFSSHIETVAVFRKHKTRKQHPRRAAS
ncbi:MAG: class I SAM-dependent RNA methyltransferase [Hyphomicrobiaceae bacterium]